MTKDNNTITREDIAATQKFFNTQGYYNRFRRMARFIIPFKKNINFVLNVGGGSYTDGNTITIGLFEFLVKRPREEQFIALKGLVGHEAEHVVSSDFRVFQDFQTLTGDFFLKNYNLRTGKRVGANMLNAVEDGRIEKRLVNRLNGLQPNIQYLRSVLWEEQPNTRENELMEYILNVCSIATSGILMKDFDKMYAGTQMEIEINKVKPLIIKAINEPTAQGCADVVFEIIQINADFIAQLMKPQKQEDEDGSGTNSSNSTEQSDPTDDLSSEPEYTTIPDEDEEDEELSNNESTHFVPEEENAKPFEEEDADSESGSGNNEDEEDTTEEGNESNSEDSEENDEMGNDASDKEDSSDDSSKESDSNENDADSNEETTPTDKTNGNDDSSTDETEGKVSEAELIREALRKLKESLQDSAENEIAQTTDEDKREEKKRENESKAKTKSDLTLDEIREALLSKDNEMAGFEILNETKYQSQIIPADLKRKGFKFHNDLEKIFKNKAGFNRKNRRKGMLDANALWRMNAGDTDIFTQKGQPQESDYVVSILVDNSGSMSSQTKDDDGHFKSKVKHAQDACAIMEEGLRGIMPFSITRFDSSNYIVRHKRIRGFEDNSKENESYKATNSAGAANHDGYSIKIAYKELMKRPEQKKVLFVLSDGEPSYSNSRYGYNHVKEAVDEARKNGVIVIAIRFGNEEFLMNTAGIYKHMYEHSFIACNPRDIQKELLKKLKSIVK